MPQTRRSAYHLVRLPKRVAGMTLPQVELIDMQEERRQRRGLHMMSARMEHALSAAVAPHPSGGRGQAILLLNRRGYANYIACPDHNCGWMMRCDHCDAAMVYHKDGRLPAGGLVRCHHCTAEQRLPKLCPVCQKKVTVFGHGTQRVEEELTRKFPQLAYLRMDSDTMRTGSDYEDTLARFRAGEADVLLGTQMIAKGLDFSGVQLVGVISGDTSLHMPDFRAAERTFQLIAQVAGRAGRSDRAGRVIVQTFSPDDEAINAAANHDYDTFAQRELSLRAAMQLPPATRMARIVVRDQDHNTCFERAKTVFDHLQQHNSALGTELWLRGPTPCPLARLADYYRYQIELTATSPGAIQKLLTMLRNHRLLVSDMHTAVDVDPVALL
jgi:primosomal protein N' (replication factor Y)